MSRHTKRKKSTKVPAADIEKNISYCISGKIFRKRQPQMDISCPKTGKNPQFVGIHDDFVKFLCAFCDFLSEKAFTSRYINDIIIPYVEIWHKS